MGGMLGRPAKAVSVEIVRQLTAADLALLAQPRGVKASPIKRLTDMHHLIARLVAQAESGYAIAAATGYSESRISILKGDPTFQELVAGYRADVEALRTEAYVHTQAKLLAGANDTIEIMHDRVLERGHEMSDKDLQEYGKFFADRTGFGPSSKSQNVNLNFDIAGQLAAGRQRGDQLIAAVPAAKAAREGPLLVGGPDPKAGDHGPLTESPAEGRLAWRENDPGQAPAFRLQSPANPPTSPGPQNEDDHS